jgi:hypothetical protein
MSASFSNIPEEMKLYLQWVVWRYEDRGVNTGIAPTKVPYDAKTGELASVSDPNTWTSYVQAVDAYEAHKYHGIGFVFTRLDPYSGIDLDDVEKKVAAGVMTRAEADIIIQRHIKVYEEFTSYAERSPSGSGLHIIVKGKVPTGRRRSQIEIYSDKRYFTMTGDVYRNSPIEPHQELLTQLWQQMGKGVAAEFYDGKVPQKESDEAVLERALKADNGAKFAALLNGNWREYYGPHMGHSGEGHSEADIAFIDIVAFYTQNREQIARIFRASQLGKRKKAQRGDYVDWMINKSFDNQLPPIEIDNLNQQLRLGLSEADKQANEKGTALVVAEQPTETEPLLPGIEKQQENVLDTLPAGLVGQIATFIYLSSVRPLKEVALCSALSLMAGICGRSYNINGAGLNFYMLLLAQTGTGKEAISSGISQLINALMPSVPAARDFIGPSNFRSDAGLIKWLAGKPSILSTMNEFGLAICQMSSRHANGNQIALKKTFLELYPKSGFNAFFDPYAYSDKDKNTPVIYSPALSILGESVPEEFYRNLDESVISGGLLPRFMTIEVPQNIRPPNNKGANKIKPELKLLDDLGKLMGISLTNNSHVPRKIINVGMAADAEILLDAFDKFCDVQMRFAGGKDVVRQLWNRAHLKALKLASLLAIGCDFYYPVITLEQAEWAKSLVIKDVLNMLGRFMRGEIGNETEERNQIDDMRKAIVAFFKMSEKTLVSYAVPVEFLNTGILPYSYLQRRLASISSFRGDRMGATFAIKRTIKILMESGVLEEIPRQQLRDRFNGKAPLAYAVSDVRSLTHE